MRQLLGRLRDRGPGAGGGAVKQPASTGRDVPVKPAKRVEWAIPIRVTYTTHAIVKAATRQEALQRFHARQIEEQLDNITERVTKIGPVERLEE